jgi:hypothetical protein
MIYSGDEWVAICKFDSNGDIRFTDEYLELTKIIGNGARRFAAYLITHWDTQFQNMLDYFGPDDATEDRYTGTLNGALDVRHDITDLWEYYGKPIKGLDAEWYRDILRSKLVTLKFPKRLIEQYVKLEKKNIGRE